MNTLEIGVFLPPTVRVDLKELKVTVGSNVLINTTYTGTEPVKAVVTLYGPKTDSNLYVSEKDKSIEIKSNSKNK